MRLSGFHKELAKLVAQGLRPKEIKQKLQISSSRLSVLKANPVFQQAVDKYRKLEDEKYNKAIKVFGDEAEAVAKEMVSIVKNPLQPAAVRGNIGEKILERLAQSEGQTGKQDDDSVMFEQILRVTKKTTGAGDSETLDGQDMSEALAELEEDLDENVIDIEALPPGNGGSKGHGIRPELASKLGN